MINITPKVSGTKFLHTSEYSVTNFSQCVTPSCLDAKKLNPNNVVKFFKETAAKYLRNILEKFSDLFSEKISEIKTRQNTDNYVMSVHTNDESLPCMKTRQSSENYAMSYQKFVESLRLYTTKLFDLLNITRFLKVMVTIHGRKIWL